MCKVNKSIKSNSTNNNNNDANKAKTICYLKSKANFIIPVDCNSQSLFIQPFGQVKVVKEQTTFDKDLGKYLTFIKIK